MAGFKRPADIPADMVDYTGDITDDDLMALLDEDTSEGAVDEGPAEIAKDKASENKINKTDLMNLLNEDTTEGAED